MIQAELSLLPPQSDYLIDDIKLLLRDFRLLVHLNHSVLRLSVPHLRSTRSQLLLLLLINGL